MMATLQVDEKLLKKAVKLGKHKTKEAAVSQALNEYIQHLEQEKIIGLFGTIEYDGDYDYKVQRTQSFMSKLNSIQIDAPEDFSANLIDK